MVKKIVFVLGCLSILAACGKDQSADDYRRDQLQQNLAKIESASGTYSGVLISKRDGRTLGALQLKLSANSQVVDSGTESKASAQPILVTNIEFKSVAVSKGQGLDPASFDMVVAAQNGYFDTDTGQFNADIKIPRVGASSSSKDSSSDNSETLKLAGSINNSGVLTGEIYALNYGDYGGRFSLSLNGEAIDTLAEKGAPIQNLIFTEMNFSGTTTFSNNVKKPVTLVLIKPESSSSEDFLTMMIPVIPLTATLNYGQGANISFNNASWDQRTNKLTGMIQWTVNIDGSPNGSTELISLSCDYLSNKNFRCEQTTNGSQGIVATSTLKPSTKASTEPPGSTATRDAVTRVYKGEAMFMQKLRAVQFSVTYAARSRLQDILDLYFPTTEKIMQAAFAITDSGIGATFQTARYDSSSGTLDATQSFSDTGNNASLSLSCQNFYFSDPSKTYNFDCSYMSSLRNVHVDIKLHSN